jgi:hypothetical protein
MARLKEGGASYRRRKQAFNPAVFERVIDACAFPLERDELRTLLLIILEESQVRAHDGDGLRRKYRRRTPEEIAAATCDRLNSGNPNYRPYQTGVDEKKS